MRKNGTSFLRTTRKESKPRPVSERITDWKEVAQLSAPEHSQEQASRCMDCGTPFCQWGCPLNNIIPEWNIAVLSGHWEQAFQLLNLTNSLPEITGRVCPAPCEYACVLGINDDPITIRENELAIVEYCFANGLIKPRPPEKRSGKKVAVIGSGPAGLSCAAQLNKAGHQVVVFERDDRIGGLLRYGIPDFKLDKKIIDRRIELWGQEGIKFITGVNVGTDLPASSLMKEYEAVCLAIGSRVARDLVLEGRDLEGIHFAMDYLTQNNRSITGDKIPQKKRINVKGRKVVIIGGGDTGADCVGTAIRQGASSVTQIEVMPEPPETRTDDHPWPCYPLILKSTTSHEEGGERYWSVNTRMYQGENGKIKKLSCVRVNWDEDMENDRLMMTEITGSELEIEAEVAIIAIGFVHPEHSGLVEELKVELDGRGNIKTDQAYMTSVEGVFAAGDAHCGQSLVMWAISEGIKAAENIDDYLMG